MGNSPNTGASSAPDSSTGPSKREMICSEILSTEETYIRGLTTLDRYYRTGLLSCGIKQKEIDRIFSSVPDILSLHNNQVLPQLQLRCTPQAPAKTRWCVAQIFIDFLKQYSLYSSFINNYESALVIVAKIRKENKQVNEVFDNAKELKETNGLDFFSLFITIVQRLPRYVLLLEDLRKNTPPSEDKEIRLLHTAISRLSTAAQEINERKAAFEDMNELGRLAACIGNIPIKLDMPGRRIVEKLELLATHQKTGALKPANYWLFNDCLIVARRQPSVLGALGKPWKVIHFSYLKETEFIDEDSPNSIIRIEGAKKPLRVKVPPPSSEFISKLYIARSRVPKNLADASNDVFPSDPSSSSSHLSRQSSVPSGQIALDPQPPSPTCQVCLIQ